MKSVFAEPGVIFNRRRRILYSPGILSILVCLITFVGSKLMLDQSSRMNNRSSFSHFISSFD